MTLLDLRPLPPEAARALLRETMSGASRFSVLGWRLPERNLDLPAVALMRLLSRLYGWPHGAMLAAGGIEGLLAEPLSGGEWRVTRRTPVWFGAATRLSMEKIDVTAKKC